MQYMWVRYLGSGEVGEEISRDQAVASLGERQVETMEFLLGMSVTNETVNVDRSDGTEWVVQKYRTSLGSVSGIAMYSCFVEV